MSKAKPKHDPKALPVGANSTDTMEQAKARAALTPSTNAVIVMESYQGNIMGNDVDLAAMVENLRKTIQDVNDGDLSRLEAMLLSQATALQTMFTSLARRAAGQEQLKHYNIFTGLALKAQAQSRATISALVDLKYPRQATFVKQANIAHGPQQVNNGASPQTNQPKIGGVALQGAMLASPQSWPDGQTQEQGCPPLHGDHSIDPPLTNPTRNPEVGAC